ncbi:hypothetical protein PRUPE_6G311100 [Prunus persica]|uniref:Uncharacterized protein n=1 Tax=Prunus persica TaxID=3760 RepID=A0A251P1L8_PRUPE|nr:hypothetical protein PRUPE_6G311100 [Prunus persica]
MTCSTSLKPYEGYVPKVEAVVTRRSYYQCVCILFQRPYFEKMYDILRYYCVYFDIWNLSLCRRFATSGPPLWKSDRRREEKSSRET